MKQFAILFIACMAMFSCRKNPDFENVNGLTFDNAALNQIILEQNQDKQKSMYNGLSPKEKLEMWKKKLEQLLADGKLNPDQKKFIEDLLNRLTEALFTPGSIEYSQFDEKAIKEKAIELFGFDDAYFILATFNQKKIAIYSGGGGNGVDCGCSTGSDWCDGDSKCGNDPCDGSMMGCGTLWWSSCNGLCRFPLIN